MDELYEGIELTEAQAAWITRGLLDLAHVDGMHDAERALITDFYAGSGGASSLEALHAQGFDLAEAAAALRAGGVKVAEGFLTACYLLIYADGEHSDAERARVASYGAALGLSPEAQEQVHVSARLFVLRSLAHLTFSKGIAQQIGASMGLAPTQIAQALEK